MPRYDYQCKTCGEFEEILRMTEHTESKPCPICGKDAPQKITGGIGVHGFKEFEGWEQDAPSGW
jgi:putative FmdB family regulatory protein